MTHEEKAAESRWYVSCLDPFGRDRSITVVATKDHVLLVTPPGQSAVLTPGQAKRLDAVLAEAMTRLERREE